MVFWALGHEDHTDPVGTGLWQGDTQFLGFLAEEGIGDLDQNAGTIPGQWVCTHGAAMRNVAEDL